MLKDVLFTHTDLDGAGCAVLFEFYFKEILKYSEDDYRIIHISNAINEEIPAFIDGKTDSENLQYLADLRGMVNRDTNITFTDICCNEENLKKIMDICETIYVYDHHRTNLWVNELGDNRPFGIVKVSTDTQDGQRVESGTSIVYEAMLEWLDSTNTSFDEFINLIRIYDTFQQEEPQWKKAEMLNKIFIQIGMENFRKKYLEYFKYIKDSIESSLLIKDIKSFNKGDVLVYDTTDMKPIIDSELESFLNMVQENESKKIADIVSGKNNRIFKFEYIHVDYGPTERYIIFNPIPGVNMSALSVEYLKAHPEYNIFAWFDINTGAYSLRSIDDMIDVGSIAKVHGGGGHFHAAGSPIPKGLAKMICDNFMKGFDNPTGK